MDKYEYRVRAEEINALIDKKEYAEAVKIADDIDWRRVKSVMMLCKVSDLYKMNRRYEESKDILLLAYDRHPGNRKIIYSLCELSIKLEEIVQAVEYYKEFVQAAPRDTGRYILQYKLYEAQDVSLEERIAVLEEYKKRDYREKWAYELAYLYHRIGLATRCVEECDELILWFGAGRYVIKAMELKMLHEPLTQAQQEKYDQRNQKRLAAMVPKVSDKADLANTLPISIKAIDASTAPTMRIPSKKVEEDIAALQEEKEELPEAFDEDIEEEPISEEVITDEPEAEEEVAEVGEVETKTEDVETVEEKTDDDIDIEIKPIDVGEYATINLQQEIAKNLTNLLAEEDMEATDATRALPIETILDSTDPELMKDITDDAIKNAIVAPLLQETQEMSPITEEDLLASLTEKPLKMEDLGKEEEPKQILRPEPLPETVEAVAAEELQTEIGKNTAEMPVSESDIFAEETKIEVVGEPEAVKEVVVEEPEVKAEETVAEEPEVKAEETVAEEPEVKVEETVTEESEVKVEETVTEEPEAKTEEAVTEESEVKVEETVTEEPEVKVEEAVTEEPEVKVEETVIEEPEVKAEEVVTEAPAVASSVVDTEEAQVDEQITGQLSFTDIMAEWEETKKATEEKHKEEMRQRMIRQTGPLFADFDAATKQAEGSQFDLISPMVDVFQDKAEEELVSEVENALLEDEEEQKDSIFGQNAGTETAIAEEVESKEEATRAKVFDTAEIRGIEEKLLDNLAQQKEEKIPELVTPSITEEESEKEEPVVVAVKEEEKPIEETPENATPEVKAEPEKKEEPSVPVTPNVMQDTKFEVKDIFATGPISQGRELTETEKKLFGNFAHTPDMEKQITYAVDHVALTSANGNLLISGGLSSGSIDLAKSVIKQVQMKNPTFSGKVAKITGSILDKKNIEKTITAIENGALIVEKAGDLSSGTCAQILSYISKLPTGKGVFIVFEDTKGNIDRLIQESPELKQSFDLRIDMQAMDNDSLVAYGKQYANELEYAIDEMGILALYTRIAEMQTNDHHVSVEEVKELIDEAIEHANKKSVGHLMDVIFAKRYDTEDMIILREKDFLKDR